MSTTVERLTDRGAIRAGIECWNRQHPNFRLPDHLVSGLFAPFAGIDVECYAGYSADADAGEPVAFGVLKRATRPIAGYDPTDLAWLSVFAFDPDAERGASIAGDLLEAIATAASQAGARRLLFGRDPQNVLAGVPTTASAAYRDVLTGADFTIDEEDVVHDLQRDIREFAPPERVRETGEEWPDLRVERATGREPELLDFLADQFPGRWHYEAENICRVPGGPEDYWVLFHDDRAVGFARSNRHDGAYRGSNVNWGWRLAEAHCGVGPLGVHEECRGRGWGLSMISEIVAYLRDAGYETAVVDWTDLPGYYEQLGFEKWIAYEGAARDL